MLKTQNKYIEYLTELGDLIETVKISEDVKENFDLSFKIKSIKNTELLVPIIGAFSAGKSSLLNAFLGEKKLPEKITPETALATELRYSEDERIEAVNGNDVSEKFPIDAIEDIKARASEFKYLKMYLKNDNLKNIEPLVLVDMPGFESPLDLHNQAIIEYINRGVHYIVLTSVEDGTITRSMVRQLTDIQEYERDFSFFLSKTNLRSIDEAEDIAQNIQEQIEEYFDIEKDVVMIDDDGGESLRKILLSINPEELFKNLFIEDLKDNYYNITETINTTISSLGKDKNENQDLINELQESLQKIQQERDRLVNEANDKYSNSSVNRIVELVGKELSNSVDELVNSAMNGGQESMSQLILEITRHALVSNLKDSMNNISNDIVDSFSTNLSSLNSSMSDFTMTDNWLEKITKTTKTMLSSVKNGINDIVTDRQKSNNNDTVYKVLTTVLATTTTVLAPIIELVIIFLPNLLGGFFEKYQQKKQEEQFRDTIMTQIIPSLKRELRSKLPTIFNQQVQEMIKNISTQFEGIIEEKSQTIESTQKEIDKKIVNIEETISIYTKVNNNITALANQTLYK